MQGRQLIFPTANDHRTTATLAMHCSSGMASHLRSGASVNRGPYEIELKPVHIYDGSLE
jgi:hypothetical protein